MLLEPSYGKTKWNFWTTQYKRPVQKVSSHLIWKIETFIEEDTRNTVHRIMLPRCSLKKAPWDLTQFSQLPSISLLYFPESHQQSGISSLSTVILVLRKARSCRVLNLSCRGAELPGSLIFVDCSRYTFNILRCSACCRPSRTWITFNRISTIFEVFVPHFYLHRIHCIILESLLNHLNSFRGGMFKLNIKFDVDLLLYFLSHLNVTATQYTCSLNDIYRPHWLVQWSLHCSRMHIPVHSSRLPGYCNVPQTVLII